MLERRKYNHRQLLDPRQRAAMTKVAANSQIEQLVIKAIREQVDTADRDGVQLDITSLIISTEMVTLGDTAHFALISRVEGE